MPVPHFKLAAVIAAALSLAACNTTQGMLGGGPAHVAKVDVSLAPNVGSPRFAEALDSKIRGQSGRFAREGVARHVRVAVTEVHYKDALQSILIGDGNYAAAEVTVVDPATGRTEGPVKAEAIEGSGPNGISGAVISAIQDKQAVDERLTNRLAWNVLVKIYGPTAARAAGDRAPVAIEPAPAAAPAAKPGAAPKSKGTPVASAAPQLRSAMATQAAPTAPATR